MNSLDAQYINLLRQIRDKGIWEDNRTGIPAKAIVGAMIQHDMSDGFPLLCCKRHSFKNIAIELEFFIRGLSSKKWLQDRGCHIWDEWCNPRKGIAGTVEMMQQNALKQDDLGRIYGVQWRGFRGYKETESDEGFIRESYHTDQLVDLLALLRKDPTSRRAIVTAWNPCELDQMALPPCHVMWQAMILGGKLHLTWYQRSVDTPLGLPYNIASYGLLLHLLARELGVGEGTLTGMLNNVHYYQNQEEAVNEIINRGKIQENSESFITNPELTLPSIVTSKNANVERTMHNAENCRPFHQWTYQSSELINYNPLPAIKIPIAV